MSRLAGAIRASHGIGADGIAGRRGPVDHPHPGRFANHPYSYAGVSWEAGLYY